MRILPFVALGMVLAGATPAARAAPPPAPPQLGLCAACHGVHGVATQAGAPNLAGQRQDYLRDALRQYRDGRRNVPAMRAAVGPLSLAQLDALAAWYSAQPPAGRRTP